MKDAELVYGEKYVYHTHYLPAQDAVDFLMAQFEAVLRGLKPRVIGIVPATGIYMVLANCFGSVYAITVNARALIITAILAASMLGYKYFAKKKLSPILLIVISAIAGVAVYGV